METNVYREFLKKKKHPEPRYGCVCGIAHMGAPEVVLGHFFREKYGERFSKFDVGHCYIGDKYYPFVACGNCGHRIFVDSAADWDVVDKFIREHKCKGR